MVRMQTKEVAINLEFFFKNSNCISLAGLGGIVCIYILFKFSFKSFIDTVNGVL